MIKKAQIVLLNDTDEGIKRNLEMENDKKFFEPVSTVCTLVILNKLELEVN